MISAVGWPSVMVNSAMVQVGCWRRSIALPGNNYAYIIEDSACGVAWRYPRMLERYGLLGNE
jgi:hypothetical protein